VTDWADRWWSLIDERPEVARRVAQGRAWWRSGRVTGLRARTGALEGKVQGTHTTPYTVTVSAPPLDDAAWQQVAAAASAVGHGARLLAGSAPRGLEDELASVGIELFPPPGELDIGCGCDDAVTPCAHAAAVWADVADRLDRDPFLLLRFRGRGRERLLAELSAARRRRAGQDDPEEGEGIAVDRLRVDGWDRLEGPVEGMTVGRLRPRPVPTLRLLGDPPGWAGAVGAWELLGPLVERAGSWADMADGEPLP
jgi:uncharacterized Zn finger protein